MENNINTLLHECDRLKERLTEIRPLPVEAYYNTEESTNFRHNYTFSIGKTITHRTFIFHTVIMNVLLVYWIE